MQLFGKHAMTVGALCLLLTTTTTTSMVYGQNVSQASEKGFVVANGVFIPPPYIVDVSSDGNLVINGTKYAVSADTVAPPGIERRPRNRGMGRVRFRNSEPNELPADQEFGRWSRENSGGNSNGGKSQLVKDVLGILFSGGLVIVSDKDHGLNYYSRGETYDFVDALLDPSDKVSQDLPAAMQSHLASLQNDPVFLGKAEAFRIETNEIERENILSMKRVRWLDQAAYPISTIGMLLIVVATGQLLSIRPPQGDELLESSDESASNTLRFVSMILAFSVLDLIWTLLASHDGSMRELNPIGSKIISNPLWLVLFKLATTGVSATILWRMRHSKRIQLASWWLCLLLTLLTARWLVFQSLLA